MGTGTRVWLLLAVLAVAFALVWVAGSPPRLKSGVVAGRADGGRALQLLRGLLAERAPHPIGSPENRRVRQRIEAELERIGAEPKVQRGVACNRAGQCGEVENVIAVLPGKRRERRAVLLAAHYDSVPAASGAGDDGAGVAALLEVARVLSESPPLERDVVLFVGDGEEAGLFGARVFVRDDPLARRVAAVINLEARGSSGASLMFEAKNAGYAQIRALAGALDRPVTTGLFSGVYERMPNDTDLTVFGAAGMLGFNFAFIDGVEHYHTPLDDLAHLDPASLQHHADNALGLVRALAGMERLERDEGEPRAVWFDWLGRFVVSWPEPWTFWLALAALALNVGVAVHRCEKGWANGLARGAAGAVVAMMLAAGIGAVFVVSWQALASTPRPWHAHSFPALLAMAGGALVAVWAAATLCGDAERASRHVGVWLVWCALALALAQVFPAAAYLYVVPSLLAGAVALALRRRYGWLLLLLPPLVAGTLWFAVARGLVAALGVDAHALVALAAAMPLVAAIPLLAEAESACRRALAFGGVALLLAGALAATLVPAFTSEKPQRVSIAHVALPGEAPFWFVHSPQGPPPAALVRAAGLVPGWDYRGPAPDAGEPPPEVSVLSPRTLRIRSLREAHVVMVASARPAVATIAGTPIELRATRSLPLGERGLYTATWLTVPERGIELTLDRPGSYAILDVRFGLPPLAEPLVEARGDAAVPSQDGDLSITGVHIDLD